MSSYMQINEEMNAHIQENINTDKCNYRILTVIEEHKIHSTEQRRHPYYQP